MIEEKQKKLSMLKLSEISGGALQEQFEIAMEEVLKNIDDLNRPAEMPRQINIKLVMKPGKTRKSFTYGFVIETKLAPTEPQAGKMFMAYSQKDGFIVKEEDSEQIKFSDLPALDYSNKEN